MWHQLTIPSNQIEASTIKAELIKMPKKSKYNGFSFWHPAKLIKGSNIKEHFSIIFSETFQFNLKKYGKGRFNSKVVVEEKAITAVEMLEAFEIINENLQQMPKIQNYHIQEPTELEEIEVVIPHDLKN